MQRMIRLVFLGMLVLAVGTAHAAKFGGGKSFGFKKPIQYRALNQKPQPAQSQKPAAGQPASQKKPATGGMLGGLLAGGLLAALFFGGAFEGMTAGDWLVLLLIAGALFWFLRRRRHAVAPALAPAGMAQRREAPVSQLKIGGGVVDNEKEAVGQADELPPPPPWFEVTRFEASLVDNFKAVQRAWDAGDAEVLRGFCSEACFKAIKDDIRPGVHQTEIEQVSAQVIDWDYVDDQFVVSVRFSGFVRENGGASRGFTEVWHLARPVDGSDNWKIVGVQQL